MNDVIKKETLVVNLFAGPGAGKTTCAWEIAEKLKKLGYVTEYVSEYAKELVWDGREDLLDGSVKNQTMVYNEQKRRVDRLIGKVDFVVTDSPALLSAAYVKERDERFERQIVDEFNQYHNFCIFVERGARFEQAGRIHDDKQSKALDAEIISLLENNGIYYGVYKHHTIDLSIQNLQKTFKKLNAGTKTEHSLKEQISAANTRRKTKSINTKPKGREDAGER